MTLREYFAGLAMQGMLADGDARLGALASDAVAAADALIAALGSDPAAPVVGPVTGNVNAHLASGRRVSPTPPEKCGHGVTFDAEAARGLSVCEIRKRWPRLFGVCPLGCGFDGIGYASWEHHVYGDW